MRPEIPSLTTERLPKLNRQLASKKLRAIEVMSEDAWRKANSETPAAK